MTRVLTRPLYLFVPPASDRSLRFHAPHVIQRSTHGNTSNTSLDLTVTDKNLYGFNRQAGDKPYPRKSDVDLDQDDQIAPNKRGLSVSADLKVSSNFLTGYLWLLPAGTDLGAKVLGVIADGKDVGGKHYNGHHSIYPATAMKYGTFKNKVKSLPWILLGECNLKSNTNQQTIAAQIMSLGNSPMEVGKLLI